MRIILVLLLAVVLAVSAATTTRRNEEEEEEEDLLLGVPNPAGAYEQLAIYTAKPHIAGTIQDYDTAVYTREMMQRYGFEAELDEYQVLLSYPIERSLRIVSPPNATFEASLTEDVEKLDPSSGNVHSIMTFLAYSATGNASASVVYANYGRMQDFQELEEMGISVAGQVVIVRYGQVFRGNKVFFAEEYGAAAVIIYSDPADDGASNGPVFPEGPYRPPTSVQRGSATFLTVCPGDPGKPERCGDIPRARPSIPIIPISSEDAYPFLSGLEGAEAPAAWNGGFDITYHIGPGPIVANIDVRMREEVTTVWNVMGELRGAVEPDRVVMLGNHRDAWCAGAADPSSGSAVMIEVARAFHSLLQNGWQPRRTLKLASWDAEEFGLVGSTEFGEVHQDQLQAEVVAYLNADVATVGSSFSASASSSVKDFIVEATASITDPNSGKPLSEVWNGNVGDLGSGSDFSVFVQHLGIASMDFSFSGPYGVYHSNYDSMYFMKEFADPNFEYMTAMAQLISLMMKRLADAQVLPFDYVRMADYLDGYVETIEEQADAAGGYINMSAIEAAIEQFREAGRFVAEEIEECEEEDSCNQLELRRLNNKLIFAEREFLNLSGLPMRPWYKSVLVAASYETGYGASVFPAISDAISVRDWDMADEQVDIIAGYISRAADSLLVPIAAHHDV